MKRIYHVTLLLVTLTLLSAVALAQNPDGDPIGRGNEVHDQRAGSMLIYNYYTSTMPVSADTRITITNTHETSGVYISLVFVEGGSGQPAPVWIYLDPAQTQSFLMSDNDPGISGYIIAFAADYQGIRLQWDYLMGTAAITLESGHRATLGALAVPMNPSSTNYAAAPRQLALDQIPSPADGVKQMLVINRIDGSLINGMPGIGSLECDLFNQYGARFNFTSRSFGPQARTYFYNLVDTEFTSANLYNYLPAGEYGWLRMRPTEAGAITGAVLYFRESEGITAPYPGGYNLRHLTNTQATLETTYGGLVRFGN